MLRTFFKREKKDYSLLTLPLMQRTGLAPFPKTDVRSLQAAMQTNELVFAAIRLLAKSANDPRLLVMRRSSISSEWQEAPDHPFTRLMLQPVPVTHAVTMDGATWLRCHIASWETTRLFFAEKVLNTLGQIVELHPLDPTCLQPRYNQQQTEIIGWTWRSGTKTVEYTNDQLLIRRSQRWYDPPPLAVASGSVALDTEQTAFVRGFFQGGGTPTGVIKVNKKLQRGEAEDIQTRWREKYGNGGAFAGLPAVFDETGDYQKIGSNLNEIDSQTLRGLAETRIAMVWGIHPTILGTLIGLQHSTYSNYREAQNALWDSVLTPMYKELLSWLQWSLLSQFEPLDRMYAGLVKLAWDMRDVAALQDDVDSRDDRTRKNYLSGLMKLNEARAILGLEPDTTERGDQYYTRGQNGQATTTGI